MIDTSDIEKRAELTRSQSIEIGTTIGGITIANPSDIEIMASRLARGKMAVPQHCRDEPGTVYALCVQALEWKMPIMSVINKSYVANNRIAYESQLIHAVIERNAPLKGRLRHQIIGEGDERRCKVWGTFKGEKAPHEYTSETLAKLREARGRNPDKGDAVKGSPLWTQQPEVQLFYSASRTWARMFAPDVILGAYTPDDPWYSDEGMKDVTPQQNGLVERLKAARQAAAASERGFDVDHVAKVIEGDATEATDNGKMVTEPARAERATEPIARRDDTDNKKGSPVADESAQGARAQPPRQDAAREKDKSAEGELFPNQDGRSTVRKATPPKGRR